MPDTFAIDIEKLRHQRAADAVHAIGDPDATTPAQALIDALTELRNGVRAEIEIWRDRRKKGWQSIVKDLEAVSVKLFELIADIAEQPPSPEPRVQAPAPIEPKAWSTAPADPAASLGEQTRAYLAGETDTPPAEEAALTFDDPEPETQELHAEVRQEVREMRLSRTLETPSRPPNGKRVAPGAMYTWGEIMTPVPTELKHWSHSQIETLNQCGLRYRATRLDEREQVPQWASIGGSAVHACVEFVERALTHDKAMAFLLPELWKERLEAEIAMAAAASSVPMEDWRASNGGREGYDWWRVEGEAMVERYVQMRTGESDARELLKLGDELALEAEVTTSVRGPLGELEFTARIDQAWRLPDGSILIVDIKCGSMKPPTTFQLGSQAHTLLRRHFEQIPGGTRILGCFYDARKGIFTPAVDLFKDHPFEELQAQVHMAEAKRRAGLYAPTPNNLCAACPVKYACPAFTKDS